MTTVDAGSFLAIVLTAALASILVVFLAPRLVLPVVVLELLLGIVIGPQGLGLANVDDFTEFFGNLGLGMLFFFAGYELDLQRIRGRPLQLGALAWALSLAIAYGIGGILAAAGIVVSLIYTGSAMATTAIGTLIPILSDAGELRTRFGTYLLGFGAVGEFGPILLITLVLSTTHPPLEALILAAFVAIAVLIGLIAVRSIGRGWQAMERTIESSSQLAIRLTVVLVFALLALATELGLDLLLGGFLAGLITRLALQDRDVGVFESKVTAVGYGFLIPFFFITSGMSFDLDALLAGPGPILKLPLFLCLFLVVRGVPAWLLYRGVLSPRDRAALAFFGATQLPLVVAITTVAVETDHMSSSTSAGLVGAAIVSTLVFPLIGLRLRRGQADRVEEDTVPKTPAAASA
jgi:Kef-type K+ transport system membrane component KefB